MEEDAVDDDDEEEEEALSEDEENFRRSIAGGPRSPDGSLNPRDDDENVSDFDDVSSPQPPQSFLSPTTPQSQQNPPIPRSRRIVTPGTAVSNFFNDVMPSGSPSSSLEQPFTPLRNVSSRRTSAASTPTSSRCASASSSNVSRPSASRSLYRNVSTKSFIYYICTNNKFLEY